MLPDESLQNKMNNKTITNGVVINKQTTVDEAIATNGITMVRTILNKRQMMAKQAKKA